MSQNTNHMTRTLVFTVLAFSVATLNPTLAVGDNNCLAGFKSKLKGAAEVVSEPVKKLHKAISDRIHKKGRAQAAEVERIMKEKAEQAEREGRSFDEQVKKWEEDVLDRMSDKKSARYPKVEELLALMAAKSPTFRGGILQYLTDKGSVRFKVFSHFMERVRTLDGSAIGGKITYGKAFWQLWQSRIKLPARRAWTSEDFALFMTEMSNATFRALHPEPGFYGTWLRAFGDIRMTPEGWKVWRAFATRFLESYRDKYRSFMEGTTLEAYGKPRPEVIADFYKFGLWEGVYRRLAAFKIAMSKKGTEFITKKTGVEIGEIDGMSGGVIFQNLPRSFKNALIMMKNPELYKDLLFAREVEQLSLEVMYFVRPVVSGLFLYYTLIMPAYGAYETQQLRAAFEEEAKKNPERAVGVDHQQASDDRIQNFEDQIAQLTIEKRALEAEIEADPSMPAEEVERRRRAIAKKETRIGNLQELKTEILRGITNVHPR